MKRDNIIVIHIPSEFDGVNLRDLRTTGCLFGTIGEACSQYGISIKKGEGVLVLRAKRRKMQKFLKVLHFSGLPYSIEK